jgi:hypothetical protein
VARALAGLMPGQRVCEPAQLAPGERPSVVVFVVSAAAPMVESDAALLDEVAERTDTVLAAVTKIDVHRGWRAVLAANRVALGGRAPRYRPVAWFGVAARPEVGPVRLNELTAALRTALARDDLEHRNRLRATESELRGRIRRGRREASLRAAQRGRAERSAALAAARLQLMALAERTCAELRAELRAEAARAGRRDRFGDQARRRAAEVVAEFGRCADRELRSVVRLPGPGHWDVPALLPMPPPRAGLENRLSALLGSGFGVGAGLALGRVLGEVLPGRTTAVGLLSTAAGIALAGWLVRTRRVLAERANLDRWVTELSAGLRSALEERVAARTLAAGAILARPQASGPVPGEGRLRRELDAVTAALDVGRPGSGSQAESGGYPAGRGRR